MNLKLPVVILLLAGALAYSGATVVEFSGEPVDNKIVLRWKTAEEVDINLFVVERSMDGRTFAAAGDVAPRGSNSDYEFIDDKLANVRSVYHYRLRIVNKDATVQYSEPITVIPRLSSFAKTWGSIKALFQ